MAVETWGLPTKTTQNSSSCPCGQPYLCPSLWSSQRSPLLCTPQRLRGTGQDTDKPVCTLPPAVQGPDAAPTSEPLENAKTWARNRKMAGEKSQWEGSFPRASLAVPGSMCHHLLLTLRTAKRAKKTRRSQHILLQPDWETQSGPKSRPLKCMYSPVHPQHRNSLSGQLKATGFWHYHYSCKGQNPHPGSTTDRGLPLESNDATIPPCKPTWLETIHVSE